MKLHYLALHCTTLYYIRLPCNTATDYTATHTCMHNVALLHIEIHHSTTLHAYQRTKVYTKYMSATKTHIAACTCTHAEVIAAHMHLHIPAIKGIRANICVFESDLKPKQIVSAMHIMHTHKSMWNEQIQLNTYVYKYIYWFNKLNNI